MPRRLALLGLVCAFLAAACGGGGGGGGKNQNGGPPGSIRALVQQADEELSLLSGAGASARPDEAIQTGTSVFAFDLATSHSQLIEGGAPQVYVAKDDLSRALGPFTATWSPYTGYAKTGDHSPRTPLPGIYAATIRIPSPGLWTFAAVVQNGSKTAVGIGHGYVSDRVVDPLGSKAVAVKTPVATSGRALREIDTREPPSPLHYISLDQALRNGKPTVVVFSTPLLCESKLCGPVTDEVFLAYQRIGKTRANFIHVEEFLPGKDLKPPAALAQNRSPAFEAWHLQTEPWVFVIDGRGIIRGRFGPGAITAPQIEAALRPLL
jgi:hypothetical protein